MKKQGASFKEAPFFLPPDSGRSFPHKLHNTFFPDFYGSFYTFFLFHCFFRFTYQPYVFFIEGNAHLEEASNSFLLHFYCILLSPDLFQSFVRRFFQLTLQVFFRCIIS